MNNSSVFTIHSTNTGTFNTGNSNFTLYTTEDHSLNGTIGTTTNPFRIVSTNTINVGAGAVLTNGTVITGPFPLTQPMITPPLKILWPNGNITVENVNIFARKLRFLQRQYRQNLE